MKPTYTKHTPGPWKWNCNFLYGKGKSILWYTINDDGIHSKPEDASLIASAPCMYEALKQVNDIIQDELDAHGDSDLLNEAKKVIKQALARAEGK